MKLSERESKTGSSGWLKQKWKESWTMMEIMNIFFCLNTLDGWRPRPFVSRKLKLCCSKRFPDWLKNSNFCTGCAGCVPFDLWIIPGVVTLHSKRPFGRNAALFRDDTKSHVTKLTELGYSSELSAIFVQLLSVSTIIHLVRGIIEKKFYEIFTCIIAFSDPKSKKLYGIGGGEIGWLLQKRQKCVEIEDEHLDSVILGRGGNQTCEKYGGWMKRVGRFEL